MKQLITAVLFFAFVNLNAQELPRYYFNIKSVLTSPYSIGDGNEGYFMFRALAVSEEGHFSIVIEQISLKGIEGNQKALEASFFLSSDRFDKYVIDKIQLLEWKSKYTFVVKVNGKEDYEIDISEYSYNKISVKKLE